MKEQTVSIREAKAHLSDLAARVDKGASFVIAKRGRPTARLVPVAHTRKPINLAQLQSITNNASPRSKKTGSILPKLRDQARY